MCVHVGESRGQAAERLWGALFVKWNLILAPGLRFQDCPEGVGLFATDAAEVEMFAPDDVCPIHCTSVFYLVHHLIRFLLLLRFLIPILKEFIAAQRGYFPNMLVIPRVCTIRVAKLSADCRPNFGDRQPGTLVRKASTSQKEIKDEFIWLVRPHIVITLAL